MKYYSTNHNTIPVDLSEAVTRGLAPDGGLFMPERITALPQVFFDNLADMGFTEMSQRVARALFPEVSSETINRITAETLAFDTPLNKVEDNIYALELFHGPTLAFKDVGARFMARLLAHFAKSNVYVLYPKGKVSRVQESQFTTLGKNITAIEIDGTFDDCQRLVKQAFVDTGLNAAMSLTSANSINIARLLPQSFYYFRALAQLEAIGADKNVVVCVPSGNFGNITAGLIARRMGLGISRFIAANNENDVFLEYLKTGKYSPRQSVQTYANAMDVGAPSNFARILELYNNSHNAVAAEISGFKVSDKEILETIKDVYERDNYIPDPHGACAFRALKSLLKPGETGIFLETAHPAKFGEVIKKAIGREAEMPARLKEFLKGEKKSEELGRDFHAFKQFLLERKDK